jgi:hypothetical protein
VPAFSSLTGDIFSGNRWSDSEGRLGMNDTEIAALLDAHDALVKACDDGGVPFAEFLAAYGDFPRNYPLDGNNANPADRDVLRLFRRRIAFHSRVASILSGLAVAGDLADTPYGSAAGLPEKIGLMRLRALVARYPQFEAEPENMQSRTIVNEQG